MIVDTHTHLGVSGISGWTVTHEDLVNSMNTHGVDMALVMPHAVTASYAREHDEVAALCERDSRFRGLASLSPHLDESVYRSEIKRCVDMGFVGVKLNPMQHVTSPLMPHAERVFRTCADLSLPVIVHTGLGGSWALPSLLIPVAQKYPDLPIVMAHAGFALYTDEAIVAASLCQNIYLEASWCTVLGAKAIAEEIGTERMMMGSDHPMNLPVELAKYRALQLDDSQLDNILGATAIRIFGLEES